MGNKASSSASASQNVTNSTVNQNMVNQLNKTIMNSSVNALIQNATTCSSAITQSNACNTNIGNVVGGLNISGSLKNNAKIDFSCVSSDKAASDMTASMISTVANEMKSTSGTTAATQLNSAADSSNKKGAFSTGSSSSKSNTAANVTNNVTNQAITNIQNIYEQNLSNNFTNKTVNECIGKVAQINNQNTAAENVTGGANIKCSLTNDLESIQNCNFLSDAVTKTTQQTINDLGLVVSADNTTASQTVATTTAKSENVQTGALQDAGSALSGIIGAFGFGSSGGQLSSILLIILCIIASIGYVMFSGGSSPTPMGVASRLAFRRGGGYATSLYDTSTLFTSDYNFN